MIRNSRYRGDAFRIVRGASGHADKAIFVYQCYLDDSGTSGLPVLTVAGFVAHINQWEQVEAISNQILNQYEVPVLHTKEFHDTKRCFTNWSRIKKRSLVKELFSPLKGRMLAVSMSIRKSSLTDMKKSTGKFQTMSAYGMCFSSIMTHILLDKQIGEQVKKEGIAFLVESGNTNNAEIEKFFHFASEQKVFEGCLRSLTFIPKAHCRAIQLADFWAFYSRRAMREHDRFNGKLVLPSNFYLDTIYRNFPYWQYGQHDLSQPDAISHVGKFENFEEFRTTLLSIKDANAAKRKKGFTVFDS